MRVALVLVAVIGCAKSGDKSARQAGEPASTVGSAAPGQGAPTPDQGALAQPQAVQTPEPTGAAPPPPPADPLRDRNTESVGGSRARGEGGAKGSAIDEARASGVLGPSDQRAFQANGKVTIKSFTSKDLDATVKGKLDALQTCYDKALQFQDTLAGELTIAVKDGKATLGKSTVKHADLEKCVIDALAGATLPKKASLVLAFKRS
ncbi:MAG TPA: hypothetical protein VIV11_17380 [Kofleriaceae bacterium]